MLLLRLAAFGLTMAYAFMFWRLLTAFLPLRGGWPLRLLGFLLCAWLADAIIYPEEWHSVAFTMVAFFCYLLLFHRGSLLEKCSVLLLFYLVLVAVNYLMTDLSTRIFFARHDVTGEMVMASADLLQASTATHLVALAGRLGFWLLAWLLLRRQLQGLGERLAPRLWILVDGVALASSVSIFSVIWFLPASQGVLAYPICGAAILSSFGSMLLVTTLVGSMRTAQRALFLEQQRDHLQARMADEERVRSIYHDLKNHLLVLEQSTPDAQEAARALLGQIEDYEMYYHSGNPYLDLILRDKARLAREKQIDLQIIAHLEDVDFIAPLDISTIFGNALDNAIEAAEKCPPGERLITLKTAPAHASLLVRVENTMVGTAADGCTSKGDPFLHGFGLANIRAAVARYDGAMSIRSKDGLFKLHIMLPLP